MVTEAVIGIDIGGTFTKFGVVDNKGKLFYENAIPTDVHKDASKFVDSLHNHVSQFLDQNPGKFEIKGIGIGAPNGNYYTGHIEQAPNLPWKGLVKFTDLTTSRFNLPSVLTNDANAAAIGEMIFGDAKGMNNFLMITLGTGLGSGLVVNGEVVYGHDGFAGELGHVNVVENGRMCGCGKRGCLETYVSATGIVRTVYELLASETDESVFRHLSYSEVDSKKVTEAAIKGDPLAIMAYKKTGDILGRKLADTVAHISPEQIFLFGGLALAGKWIFEPTIQSMEENLLPVFRNKIKIAPSALLQKNIAVLGAAALIWKELI